MEKYMSIGSSCHISELLRNTNRRISGPYDWMENTMVDSYRSIIYHLSDITYENILLRKFSPTIGIEIFERGTTLDFSSTMWYPHHDLTNVETLKTFIRRFNRFREHIRSGGNLIFMIKPKSSDTYSVDRENFISKVSSCIDKFNLSIGKFIVIEPIVQPGTYYDNCSQVKNIIWIRTNIPFSSYYTYRDNKREELLNKPFNDILSKYDS